MAQSDAFVMPVSPEDAEPFPTQAIENAYSVMDDLGMPAEFREHFDASMAALADSLASPRDPQRVPEAPIFELRIFKPLPKDDVTLIEINLDTNDLPMDILGQLCGVPLLHVRRIVEDGEVAECAFTYGSALDPIRLIGMTREDDGRWNFYQDGTPFPWEEPEYYRNVTSKTVCHPTLSTTTLRPSALIYPFFARAISRNVSNSEPLRSANPLTDMLTISKNCGSATRTI